MTGFCPLLLTVCGVLIGKANTNCKMLHDLPSTSNTSNRGKRQLEDGESPPGEQPHNTAPQLPPEKIKRYVEGTMRSVLKEVQQDKDEFGAFLKEKITDKIKDLERHEKYKSETIGVFGRTGAGKSSMINAVIEEENLLQTGVVTACTSAMIKVEANRDNQDYQADIEFISSEEWLSDVKHFHEEYNPSNKSDGEASRDKNDGQYSDFEEKIAAVYGNGWRSMSHDNFEKGPHSEEIQEFLNSEVKTVTADSAENLSKALVRYTAKGPITSEGQRCYWPLVKCVTIKVPRKRILEHVRFVDLPGNGDRNKSRNDKWQEVIQSCSIVWIVANINRVGTEKECWEILKRTCSLMGNGGQCREIHMICTQVDNISREPYSTCKRARDVVEEDFKNLENVKKHFKDDCFKVFTVSSTEVFKRKQLSPVNEMPKLQKFLKKLNNRLSETSNYVSGAHGILSLIQGAHTKVAEHKEDVSKDLEKKMQQEFAKLKSSMSEAIGSLKKCLCEAVEISKHNPEELLEEISYTDGRGFHKILKCVVQRNGIYTSRNGTEINLNASLASDLTGSIDTKFKETFPNDKTHGPFYEAIEAFSLGTEGLIETYKDVELQLIFLKSEEEKIKPKLKKIIQDDKKNIYRSLETTIQENMQVCYDKAAKVHGDKSLERMKTMIEDHVRNSKDTMFEEAKVKMLSLLTGLMDKILKTLEDTLNESIEMALKTDGGSLPDVRSDLDYVKYLYDQLLNEETQ